MRSLTQLLASIQQAWPVVEGAVSEVEELTISVPAQDWHAMALYLRDQMGFEQLIDLCAVDYTAYGQVNWATDSAVNAGFSRGVFDFEVPSSASEAEAGHQPRFAVVSHLLSIAHNQRIRVKVFVKIINFQLLTVFVMYGHLLIGLSGKPLICLVLLLMVIQTCVAC